MNTTAQAAAPKRVRVRSKPKALRTPEQVAEEEAFIEAGGVIVGSPDEARRIEAKEQEDSIYRSGFDKGIAHALADSLSIGDLRAKLDETAGFRQRLAAEIDRISTSLAEHQRALIGCDGALQVLGQLIEAVEAKSKEGEA